MYSDCGLLGYFRTFATSEEIRIRAEEHGVCGEGTAWDATRAQCTAGESLGSPLEQFAIVDTLPPRAGKCECNGLPVLTRTKKACDARDCLWTEWNS